MDVSNVKVPRKQALSILEQVRKDLVQHLVEGMSRKQANALEIERLSAAGNILSPYAHYVVTNIIVTDEEIEMRRDYGDDVAEAFIELMRTMRKTSNLKSKISNQ